MLLIIAFSGLAGFLIAEGEPRIVAEKEEEEHAVQAGADNDRITNDTVITWDYEYDMCKHHVYVDAEPDPEMIGLSFSQLQDVYPNVHILSFTAEEVVLKKSFNCYCPEHYMLKKSGDKLAVYRTAAGSDKQDMYINIDIDFKALEEDDQQALEAGRVFSNFDDLQTFLEKMTE
jgi:hypothetical protein